MELYDLPCHLWYLVICCMQLLTGGGLCGLLSFNSEHDSFSPRKDPFYQHEYARNDTDLYYLYNFDPMSLFSWIATVTLVWRFSSMRRMLFLPYVYGIGCFFSEPVVRTYNDRIAFRSTWGLLFIIARLSSISIDSSWRDRRLYKYRVHNIYTVLSWVPCVHALRAFVVHVHPFNGPLGRVFCISLY